MWGGDLTRALREHHRHVLDVAFAFEGTTRGTYVLFGVSHFGDKVVAHIQSLQRVNCFRGMLSILYL